MSFQDEFDERRFGPMGQVIGVTYGGSVHQPTITYSNIPQRLPDPGPRYGESRPPIIIDNTDGAFENPFYRTPRYSGGVYNNAFQNFNGQQLFTQMLPPIDPAAHRNQMRQKKIYDKGKGTDNPFEAETFLRRTGPQLPLAAIPPMGFQNKFVS